MSPVPARELVALVDDALLAVAAREADGAAAGVVLASVEAGRPVVAGPVVGAEVEILVAHLAAPAFVAVAGPGLAAGAVDAAGVDLALGAQRTLPALVTSGQERPLLAWEKNVMLGKNVKMMENNGASFSVYRYCGSCPPPVHLPSFLPPGIINYYFVPRITTARPAAPLALPAHQSR